MKEACPSNATHFAIVIISDQVTLDIVGPPVAVTFAGKGLGHVLLVGCSTGSAHATVLHSERERKQF